MKKSTTHSTRIAFGAGERNEFLLFQQQLRSGPPVCPGMNSHGKDSADCDTKSRYYEVICFGIPPTHGDTINSSATGMSFCTASKWWEVSLVEPLILDQIGFDYFPISPLRSACSGLCVAKLEEPSFCLMKPIILNHFDRLFPVAQKAPCPVLPKRCR